MPMLWEPVHNDAIVGGSDADISAMRSDGWRTDGGRLGMVARVLASSPQGA